MAARDAVLSVPGTSPQYRERAARRRAARDWDLSVERGPNWLFVRVNGGAVKVSDLPPLAGRLRSLLENHFTNRIVLELDRAVIPCSYLVRQLERLDRWIGDRNGVLRLCGVRARYAKALSRCGFCAHWAFYRDRQEAVFGRHRF